MRKLALAVILAASAFGLLAAMTRPPVEQLVEGQQQCSNGTALCIGDKKHVVKLQGQVSFEATSPAPVAFTLNVDGGLSTISPSDNYVKARSKALINYDFPAATQGTIGAFQSVDSPTATIANCPFGSQLSVGVDQAVGASCLALPFLSAANTAFVRMFVVASDGGVCNMPDASYIVGCNP